MILCQVLMGHGLVVAIVEMCWSWGWSVGIGGCTSCGHGLLWAEALLVDGMVDLGRVGYPASWGSLVWSVLLAECWGPCG